MAHEVLKFSLFQNSYLGIFLWILEREERGGGEREEKRERDIDVMKGKRLLVASCMHLDQGSNLPGRCVP